MSIPLVSGLSLGLRTRTKFILLLLVVLAACYLFLWDGSSTLDSGAVRSKPFSAAGSAQESVVIGPLKETARTEVDAGPRKAIVKGAESSIPDANTVVPDNKDVLNEEFRDPTLDPLVASFLNGRLPTSITGRALSRVYEWAQRAEVADAEARAAYDAAIDAKAMLFISAATDLDDLVDRYWQTHILHYNASVQLAAAERVREFLLDPTFAIKASDTSFLEPKRTPICLVTTYEGQQDAFPEYATVLVDSVARNAPYADLHIFVHNVTKKSFPLHLQRPNVKLVDLAQVEPSYRYRGFAGFAADRLCKLFRNEGPIDAAVGWDGQDSDCAILEKKLGEFVGRGGKAIDQLRGLWGVLFDDWVSSNRCESWGWVDIGTAVGDMARWMDNTAIKDADIVTAHEGDHWRLYLRNSFTVHSYRRQPTVVKDLWRRCPDLATLPALIKTFGKPNDWLSLTEGCYSYGALTAPGTKAILAPWQLPSWTDTRLLILHDGRANYCVGESNAEICRGWVRKFMEDQESEVAANKKADKPYNPAKKIFSSPPRSQKSTPLARSSSKCSEWLPVEYNLCLADKSVPSKRGDRAYIQTVHTDATTNQTSAQIHEYTVPSDGVGVEGVEGRGVGETLVVRFLDWARKKEGGKGKEMEPKVEKTWFYSVEKGSVQITPGKILLHTVSGWW